MTSLFSRTLESWQIREIIPFYGRTTQVIRLVNYYNLQWWINGKGGSVPSLDDSRGSRGWVGFCGLFKVCHVIHVSWMSVIPSSRSMVTTYGGWSLCFIKGRILHWSIAYLRGREVFRVEAWARTFLQRVFENMDPRWYLVAHPS